MKEETNNKEPRQPLNYKVKTDGFRKAGLIKTESVTRVSPDSKKLHQVILFYYGEKGSEPDKVPSDLKIATYSRSRFNPGWYFDRASQQWNGSYEDASLLRDVIDDKFKDNGKYQQLSGDSTVDSLAQTILEGKLPADSAEQIIKALADNPEAYEVFKDSDASKVLATSVNQYRQQQAIEALDTVVREPTSSESDIQEVLDGQWWIFGGRFIDQAKRRSLTVLDQLDIPLIRSDGSLHVVELKIANLPKLVKKHRNHLMVSDEVHAAVSQAMNYLVALDEQRAQILTDLKIDVRRASATVIVGHVDFVEEFTPEEIAETIRIYNSHNSRVEVITFDELVSGARRSLDFTL